MKKIFQFLCYPLIVACNFYFCYTAIHNKEDLGFTSFKWLFFVVTYFLIMERIIPYKKEWLTKGKEWLRDSSYFILNIIFGGLAQTLVNLAAIKLAVKQSVLPLGIELVLAILISSFVGYWFHRISHYKWWMWRVHGIHHVPDKVNLSNNSVVHFFDLMASTIFTNTAVVLGGFSETAVFITGMFTIMQGYFIHANIDVRMYFFNYIICSPELHRYHHSKNMEEAGNFGTDLSLWDVVFRSFTFKPGTAPGRIGVATDNFPSPFSIPLNMVYPFSYQKFERRKSAKEIKKNMEEATAKADSIF